MVNVKEEIILSLNKVLAELGFKDIKIALEHPADEAHGDYSSNIALAIFSSSKLKTQSSKPQLKAQKFETPMELAEKIVAELKVKSEKLKIVEKIEAVAPGFINFWLSKEYLINTLLKPQMPEKTLSGKNVMVEFTDPNPFKEFHIGHLYSNTVGESISRLLEALGANLKRANYQGDVGMHVAKALYGIFHLCHAEFISASQMLENEILKRVQDDNLNKRIKFLGQCYTFGAKDYEVSEKAKREMEQLNKKIYDKDPAIMGLYEKGRQWSLEYFETIYKRLGTKFDFYYFESEVGIDGLKLVKEYLKKGIFEKSQNAVIFPGEKYGLHNRVFINSLGLPTYEAKDLGLAFKKYADFKFDQSISVTGNEIIGYFKVILAALKQINPELAAKMKHLPHGMVRLPIGKMSSRTGNIVTGEWLLDEAKKLLGSKYSEMNEETLEKVAVGAVKYALLKSSLGHDIEFDFKESINIQGNSGPYLQYTFARTQSVLAKVGTDSGQARMTSFWGAKRLQNLKPEEISLLRSLNRFSEIVEDAGGKFAPNILCNYLFDLAQKFNLFYQKHKILGEIGEIRDFRITLTAAVGQTLKNGLSLLGISAPKKM